MSKFSEKCKELLFENGSNVYRISKSASLERTTLQRMVTGKRLPNPEFLKSFCSALRLSFSEEQELLNLYNRELIGESAYQNQKSILHLFAHLNDLEKSNTQPFHSVLPDGDLVLMSPIARHSCDTELLLHFIFQKLFRSEKDCVLYTNLPANNSFLQHYLSLFSPQANSRIVIKQLLFFYSNETDTHENLEILNEILPLCFFENICYEPYYYYRKHKISDQEYLMFPYFIITPDHVLQLSSDLKRSILSSDPAIVRQYTDEFLQTLSHTAPLLCKPDSLDAAMTQYFGSASPDEIFTLETSLCDSDLFSFESLQALAAEYFSLSPDMAQNYTNLVGSLIKDSHRSSFFTRQGVDTFCTTGVGSGTSGFLFSPLDAPHRLEALRHFLATFDNSKKTMLNDDFVFPKTLYLELRDNTALVFIRMEKGRPLTFLSITESSICHAFYEFFHILEKSEYACPVSELTSLITEAESQLNT